MTTIKDYLDYAELAQASYGDLVAGMFGKANTQYFDELTRKDFYGEIKFSPTQATNFANRYKVLAVADPYLTGLDAVLFGEVDENNNLTSKRILSIRGTSSVSDVFSDILLAKHGVAYDQLAALNSFYNQWLLDGIIPIGTKLDVTGHSLGGVLAQSFTLAHPNEVGSVYSYNAPGIGGLSAEAYEALGLTSGNIANVNITNIYAKEGVSVTSGLGTMIGNVVSISIDNIDPLSNHRIPYTAESLHIYNMLSSIANTQDLNLLTSILEHTSNEKALSIVSDVFQYEVSGSVVDKAIELTKKWSGDATGLTSLVDKTSSQLQSKRVENIYALLNLNPFVIEGDYLPAYSTINPTDYSDVFLANRADYLYYTLDKHNRYDVVRGLQDYEDFTLGSEYDLSKGANVGKVLFGGDIDNTSSQMQGGSERDYLFGMAGNDTLVGNGGNDYLEGGKGFDILQGGADYDTYIADNGDTVMDSDGKGIVYFQEEHLSGGTIKAGASCSTTEVYYGDGGVYSYDKLTKKLTFTKDGTNETLNIENFTNTDLGITLKGAPTCPTTTGDCPKPVNPVFNFNFSLPTPTRAVTYGTGGGGSTYSGGGGGGSSTPHKYTPAPAPAIECINSPVYHSAGVGGGGSSTGPIVLDLNRDSITSISIAASSALFDYDGDGVKENTAWIQSSDALLVSDTNHDGIINNASELFGNYTKNSDGTIAKSGYQALSYYDTNNDGVVNSTDTRFNELSLWIDSNQDGVTNTGELKTLSEMGVTSLALNSATPYTPAMENTNTIIQETTFTDTLGEGIMRDVLFRYENTSNPTDGVYFDMDANGIKEKMTTWSDPNEWMIVKDINNDGQITSGKEVVGNHMTLPNGTKAADTIQALKIFDINHDGKVDSTDNSGLSFWTDRNHNGMTDVGELEALGAAGAIQTIKLNPYQTLLSGYDNNHDGVINSNDKLYNYLYIQTNADDSVTLYLPDNAQAKEMIAGYTGGESIQTPQGEKIIKTIQFYSGYEMSLNDELNGTDGSETLEGSSRSETMRGKGGRDIIEAGAGDDTLEGGTQSDKLMGGEGNDTYIYNRGDGKDLIIDSSGNDTIAFAEGITKDDLIIKTNGVDISICLKDGSKPLLELSDQIIIKDWHTTSTLKTVTFSDGTSLNAHDIVQMFATDKNDTIYATQNSETIYGGKGNDTLIGRGGSDTYLFGRGDGKDTIIDSGGLDTLEFGEGISTENIIVKASADSNDLVIALKEEGKTFAQLSDKVTLKNWFNANSRIENITFSDGTILNGSDLVNLQGTDEADTTHLLNATDDVTLNLGEGDDTVVTADGNDVLIGGTGTDILEGGNGNDTYLFSRGEGKDTIIDSAGLDTLEFGEGISTENIIVKASADSNDLILALKEEGKTFAQLSDKVTLKNWFNANSRIENITFSDGSVLNGSDLVNLQGTDEADTTHLLNATDDVTLNLGEGDDTVVTADGNDVLIGGTGTDILEGGSGNDTYLFSRGEGKDTIIDSAGLDTLEFGEGISTENIIVKASADSNDLIIALKEANVDFANLADIILIRNWNLAHQSLERVTFTDGTVLGVEDIVKMIEANDTVYGTDQSENINTYGGYDTVYAGGGNDTVDGGVDDDYIEGGAGNDILIGGEGNDTLSGGSGNDIYVFNRGDGVDTIVNYGWNNAEDIVRFGSSITADDLIVKTADNANDLIIGIKEDGKTFDELTDKIVLKNWFDASSQIKYFEFSDGSVLNPNDIVSLQVGTSKSEVLRYLDGNDTIEGKAGDDKLYGGGGNDTYIFNRGDGTDTIYDSTYYTEAGGNDTLQFGEGIIKDDVLFRKDGSSLVLALREDGVEFENLSDKVTISDWYGSNLIENFKFSDGTIVGTEWIVDLIGTDEKDTMYGTSKNETIMALAGDDTINAGSGNDTLFGGLGNDTLYGDSGNDTYVFNIGDGSDIINDQYGSDVIEFGEGITQESLRFHRFGNTLIIGVFEEGKLPQEFSDKISVRNWFSGSYYQNKTIRFSDGTELTSAEISSMSATYGSSNDDIVVGTSQNDKLIGLEGSDIIVGNYGNDAYIFNIGDGKDTIYESSGIDKIVFGEGISADSISVTLRKTPVAETVAISQYGYKSDITVLKNGNFVVVNESNLAQMYSSDGAKIGEQFPVVAGYSILALADGGFIVSDDKYIGNANSDIIAQRYDATGTAIGSSFTVNSYTSSYQWSPGSVVLNDGSVVIVWESSGQDGSFDGIYGQRISVDGSKIGTEFRVNTYTTNNQSYPSITSLKEGGFMVAWQSHGQDGSQGGIFAQKYDANGLTIGSEVKINNYTQDSQAEPALTVLENGDIVVSWCGYGANGYGIYLNRYDASGNVLQEEFKVDKDIKGNSYDQDVTSLSGGGFVVCWAEYGSMGSNIKALVFNADGTPANEEFIVNDFPLGKRSEPSVEALENGNFAVIWSDDYTYTKMKRFDANGNALMTADEFSNDLVITLKDYPNDEIVIKDLKAQHMVESLVFADGTTISIKELDSVIGVEGLNGSNILESDELIGTSAADQLIGGIGDDYLTGGKGADTYLFNRGDGHDAIYEYYNGGVDTILFGEGIVKEDLVFKNIGGNLIVGLKEDGKNFEELNDTIEIANAFYMINGVEKFVFANREEIAFNDFEAYGAFDGNDQIQGTAVADTINAGTGNDTIDGGEGNDVYIFNRGDGQDIINYYYNTQYRYYAGTDRIRFGEGITKSDVIAHFSGSSYVLAIKEEDKIFDELNDKITLTNWNSIRGVVSVEFSDGTTLDYTDMLSLQSGTEKDDVINLSSVRYGVDINVKSGNDTVTGTNYDDIINGGSGNDTLYGQNGNDTYLFGRGDGVDTIIEGSEGNSFDVLRFKEGITVDDIIIKQNGYDFIIGLKEDGKIFTELSDKITIQNGAYYYEYYGRDYTYSASYDYRVEKFEFADGTEWSFADIVAHTHSDENDVIHGFNSSDTLAGGKGDDILKGYGGDDTYIFNRGDGKDVIYDSYYRDNYDGGNDTLKLGEGINADDIIVQKSGMDIILAIKEDGVEFDSLADKITLQNWYQPNNRIEHLLLNDGSEIDLSYLFNPTQEDDYLLYGSEDNSVDALGGDDEIYTNGGDDILIGRTGNDILHGGYGNDTYVFNRGDGQDTIFDDDYSLERYRNIDTIRFGEGITKDDLIVLTDWSGMIRQEKVLTIALKEAGVSFEDLKNKINISNWDYHTIERIEFNDGTILSTNEIIALQSTDQNNIVIGTNYDDIMYGEEGNDILYGLDANDTLIGGKGSDKLHGGDGDDTYVFERGDSYDIINDWGSNSEDILQFGDGITIGDIVVEVQEGDLLVALKEEGKSFEELSDKIRILDWESNYYSNAVETIKFSDGTTYSIAEYFNLPQSQDYYGEVAPIVFDLNGNGITSTATESNSVYFDYNDDGLRELTGWAERGDALLAVDVNHDGLINDGSELFGDHTKLPDGSTAADGYAAMQLYDSNHDGKIDSLDTNFNDLLLWRDTNLDGQSSQDELSTLATNGIVSIDLSPNPLDVAENGNRISYETTYTQSNGTNGVVRDLWFETVSDDTIQTTNGEIADTGSFSDSFDDFITETTLEIDSIKSMEDSGIDSFTLQSRYTGSGLDGASAQTVFEGVGYTGTLSNVWLKSDTLDTQYTYNGTLSDDIKALPSIDGQGNVINLQEAMNEKSDLALSVSEFQNLSETGNLADFEANIDAIIEEWALYDLEGENVNSTPPIVLDLDRDALTSTSLSTSNAYFDYDGDGRREHTAWSDAGDALLAVDLDNDGVITSGAELFGNYTMKADGTKAADGYDAMAQYDGNGDNMLNASDEKFSTLRVWIDANQNGKNDARELSTLAQNGISAINLSRTEGTTFTQITEAGNIITNETNYVGTLGDGVARDVWFSYDGTDTIAYSSLSDSDEKKIAIVENFYGRRLNSEERNSVEVIAEVLNQYNALRYDTIAKIITDKLYGEGFPNCQFLHDALNNTLGRVVAGTASATETLLSVNLLASLLKREHVSVLADIYPSYFSNPTIAGLLAQSNIAIGFEDGALVGHIGNRYFGTSSAETLDFSALDGVRAYMSGGDDNIIGTDGIDEIIGGEGNDTLNGKSGNDVLEGGQGDDILIGASAQNVYRYAWGDGVDTVIDAGSDKYAPDTIRFSDLDISRVSIKRINDDMIIHIRDELGELLTPFGEAFGSITIRDGYTTGKIEHFYFKDTRYTMEEVLTYAPADTNYYFVKGDGGVLIDEKGGEDTLYFGEGITQESIIARIIGEDLIIALAKEGRTFDTASDKITILNYSDAIEHFIFDNGSMMELSEMVDFAQAHLKIIGSDESETLYGSAESEIFDGGLGDDTIYGEGGDDIYRFGLGDGKDKVIDSGGADKIIFKAGINALNVSLTLDGEDLLISLEDGSTLRAVSWLNSENRIESITDEKGISVDFSDILKPSLSDLSAQTDEDTAIGGSVSVTDISQTNLIYTVVSNTSNGIFTINELSGEWSYIPNSNFNGSDSIVVSVTNGYGIASTSTITLNIASVNDAPTIEGEDIAVTLRNTLTSDGQIIADDIDGDTLTYAIETQASHGELSVDENGRWSYTTVDGYDGQDSALIRVSDGNGGSVEQALNFTIIDNTAPEAALETSHTLQDIRSLSGNIGASDADGDALSYTITTDVANGTLSVDVNGSWNYTAVDGYMGEDIAVISIDDMNGGVITQTLNFDIEVSAPLLANTTANLLEDTSSAGMFDVVNPIGGVLTYEILNTTAKGDFNVNESGEWRYTPSANINGNDSVTLKVTNTYGLSTTSTLSFAIEAVNDTPITTEQENYTLQDTREQSGQVEATDADGDVLTYTVSTQAQHGTLSVDAEGEWIYSVEGTYIGVDFAVIRVDDAQGGSVTKTLNFDAKVSNPTINTSTLNLQEDTSAAGTLSVTNPIGGALTYEVLSGSSNAEFILNSEGNFSYTPNANYNGSDLVEVKVTNEYGLSSTAILNFEIEAVNDAPILLNSDAESYTLQNVREVDGIIEAEDIDGDTLNYTVTTAATQGTFSIDTNGNWSYKANASFNGSDSAIITIDDGNGGSAQKVLNFSREGYLYEGEDLIIEDNGSDTLVMDSVSKNDLTFVRSANDLEILVKEQGEITLKNYFTNIDSGVATLQTAQGDINLSKDVIKNTKYSIAKATDEKDYLLNGSNYSDLLKGNSGNDTLFGGSYNDYLYGKDGNDLLIGGEGNDNLYGDAGNDNIYGDAGNDNLYGGYGNDALIGGVGNDTLYAEEGDDFLSGGKGEDYLRGGLGNDTYFFSKGDDKDTVYDSKPSKSFLWFNLVKPNGGEDKIVFAKDVSKEDVSFYMKSGDLFLQYGIEDSLIIKNQDNESSQIEKIELSDGNYLTNDDIDLVVQQINAYGSQNGMWHMDNQTIQNNVELMNIVSSAWRA